MELFKPTISADQISPIAVAQDLMDRRTAFEKVKHAINQRKICVAYQPIVNANNFRKVLAFEVLVRILDDFDRVISAGQFMEIIENDELGRLIDTEVLLICVKKLNENKSLSLSLNVSARSIGHPPWRTAIEDAVRRDPTFGERLIIEFTEQSVNTVPEYVTMFMRDMRGSRMMFALDRFGSGQTTFHTFKKFMFDIVKFDYELTRETQYCNDTDVLVQALVDFSHYFDMGVVVDRIENEEQLIKFRNLKVDFLQGNYFGRPKLQK